MKNLIIQTAFLLFIFLVETQAQFTKLKDFTLINPGRNPSDIVSDGTWIYGMTGSGGVNEDGLIYKVKTDGSSFTRLFDFKSDQNGSYPCGSLTLSNSTLYGMTYMGGLNNYGTIFSINTDGSGFKKLFDFNGKESGNYPYASLILHDDYLYGMTNYGGASDFGVIFRIKKDGSSFTKMADFDGTKYGEQPRGSLTIIGDTLFGLTSEGGKNDKGTIFKIQTNGNGFAKVFDFEGGNGGCWPSGSLVYSEGWLYGTTLSEWGYNGVLFKIKTNGSNFIKIINIDGMLTGNFATESMVLIGDTFFIKTEGGGLHDNGTIFKVKKDGTGLMKLADIEKGSNLSAKEGSLIIVGDTLYGTLSSTDTMYNGGIFKLKKNDSILKIIVEFNYAEYGSHPKESPVLSDNILYGMTSSGGDKDFGTIYKINTDGTNFVKLSNFDSLTWGGKPVSSLTILRDTLYGICTEGGNGGSGFIFKLNKNGTGFKNIANFYDYCIPRSSLTMLDNKFYGMTLSGGTDNLGTIFELNTNGLDFKTLYNFNDLSGFKPRSSLVYSNNILYGFTSEGGEFYAGTIFKINTDGSQFEVLANLSSIDGQYPVGSPLINNGILYGMTLSGGANNLGTIFKINIDGTGFKKIGDFDDYEHGNSPSSSLTLSGETLYGTTYYGGKNNFGVIFRINIDGSGFTKLFDFDGESNGAFPCSTLILQADNEVNNLYGATYSGGSFWNGVIFKYTDSLKYIPSTSIDKIKSNKNILIYPNPTKDILHIDFSSMADNYNVVSILNISGRVLYSKSIQNTQAAIELDLNKMNFNPGVYMIKLGGQNDNIVRIFIKE